MEPILLLLYRVIDIYFYILIINIVLSWLIAFNIVNMQNKIVVTILYATNRLTDPLLNPVRRILPNLGGIDISPIILVLCLLFVQDYIRFNLYI
ncbi:YggT family protein [Pelagibacterales bacterium]|jgi:YggT family protein|nr:YggT family protein [Pelagibacterales bacterium]MDA9980563.1 YggT family protein [Pelagibacterales bacterium]MDB4220240.1 YggT family protein [Pelagibacterales bacterium]MDB9818136.1 YggT family protein [Pelagibacterales bacterium]MDB9955549.1 YggT family protein [Pelagibacterales bacterium]|tara:strand:+ start:346 stop:627 length:282 start_codon:yes stop_codon:yes gene_type:complete